MRNILLLTLSGALCALAPAVAAAAASKSAAAPAHSTAKAEPARWASAPETISGRIMMVEPDQKIVVVTGAGGVTFDMVVTRKTRIRSGNETLNFNDLKQFENKNVSVKFLPERRGDIAESIRIGA